MDRIDNANVRTSHLPAKTKKRLISRTSQQVRRRHAYSQGLRSPHSGGGGSVEESFESHRQIDGDEREIGGNGRCGWSMGVVKPCKNPDCWSAIRTIKPPEGDARESRNYFLHD